MVHFLVTKLRADLNLRLETHFENKLEGTSLILAVRNGDFAMTRFLCKELGMNVNATMTMDDRQTTLIHFAIWEMIK